MLCLRMNRPTAVTRGSRFSLKTGPLCSLAAMQRSPERLGVCDHRPELQHPEPAPVQTYALLLEQHGSTRGQLHQERGRNEQR